jgi:hypothetical protein
MGAILPPPSRPNPIYHSLDVQLNLLQSMMMISSKIMHLSRNAILLPIPPQPMCMLKVNRETSPSIWELYTLERKSNSKALIPQNKFYHVESYSDGVVSQLLSRVRGMPSERHNLWLLSQPWGEHFLRLSFRYPIHPFCRSRREI